MFWVWLGAHACVCRLRVGALGVHWVCTVLPACARSAPTVTTFRPTTASVTMMTSTLPLLLCASAGNLDAQRLGLFFRAPHNFTTKSPSFGANKKGGRPAARLQDYDICVSWTVGNLFLELDSFSRCARLPPPHLFSGGSSGSGVVHSVCLLPAQAALPFCAAAVFHHRLYCIARTGALVTPFYSLFPARLPSLPGGVRACQRELCVCCACCSWWYAGAPPLHQPTLNAIARFVHFRFSPGFIFTAAHPPGFFGVGGG